MLFKKKKFDPHKVTPLSKGIALALFIAMPFIGFCLGTGYQKIVSRVEISNLKMEVYKLEIANEVLKGMDTKLDSLK